MIILKINKMGGWHSADEKVTKCHVRGEGGSASQSYGFD